MSQHNNDLILWLNAIWYLFFILWYLQTYNTKYRTRKPYSINFHAVSYKKHSLFERKPLPFIYKEKSNRPKQVEIVACWGYMYFWKHMSLRHSIQGKPQNFAFFPISRLYTTMASYVTVSNVVCFFNPFWYTVNE